VEITGTTNVGDTLTATVSDPDGIENATISYQWSAGGVAITGATASTYVLTDAEVGETITVQASYTDDQGFAESPTDSTDTTVAAPPVITVGDTTVVEDIAQVVANASDIDGEIVSSSLSATYGTVALASNGDIIYTPDVNYHGTDMITVSVTDNDGATTTRDIDVIISAVADHLLPEDGLAVTIGDPLINTTVIDPTLDEDTRANVFSSDGLTLISSGTDLKFTGNGIGVDDVFIDAGESLTVEFTSSVQELLLGLSNMKGETTTITLVDDSLNTVTWTFEKVDNKIMNETKTVVYNNGDPTLTESVTWDPSNGQSDTITIHHNLGFDNFIITATGNGVALDEIIDPRIADSSTYTYPISITAQLPEASNTEEIASVTMAELPANSVLQVYNTATGLYEDLTTTNGAYDIPLTLLDQLALATDNSLPDGFTPLVTAVTQELDGIGNVIDTSTTTIGGSEGTAIDSTDNSDYIDGRGGSDTIDSGAGDDILVYDSADALLDGNIGNDSLLLSMNSDLNFDIDTITQIKNIEKIDLSEYGDHRVDNLSVQDVLDITDTNNELFIDGETEDVVTTDGTLKVTGETVESNGHVYDVYTDTGSLSDAGLTLNIEQSITVDPT
ncbi:MAG: Ig-like domain-containing protein, partial [Campylobacterota bacterium]|nr:Ig-like domain-containing protein [Campylobacterota bacterium]